MYYIYIIYSETPDRYYVGYSNDPYRRLDEHNSNPFNTYTSKHRPWILKAIFECGNSKSVAMAAEKFIKKQKSRRLLINMITGENIPPSLAQLVRVPM